MKANDAVHKERQLRKRDSRMIRLMYENPLPQIGLPCHMHHLMRKIESWRPLRAFGKDHNKLIRQPTRTIGIEPMETHTTIQPLEECIVLDLHIQRFLS
jgi:hypothetical protein